MTTVATPRLATSFNLPVRVAREYKDTCGKFALGQLDEFAHMWGLSWSGRAAVQALRWAYVTGRLDCFHSLWVRDANLPAIFKKLDAVVAKAGECKATADYALAWAAILSTN